MKKGLLDWVLFAQRFIFHRVYANGGLQSSTGRYVQGCTLRPITPTFEFRYRFGKLLLQNLTFSDMNIHNQYRTVQQKMLICLHVLFKMMGCLELSKRTRSLRLK